MKLRIALLPILSVTFLASLAGLSPASADSSHARVIRLSLVQGDVRFTRAAHGDPLADSKATWETAQANLPIRQGYVVATDGGRAEVEFENGAMAFLSENTVLDFYDLSLDDGARTTRLVLRQGSASFYVNLAPGDYFSVTGGDFTTEASGKTSFRINNFDDGSNINVLSGRVSVLHNNEPTQLSKGQSLSMKAGEDSVSVARLPEADGFDNWVSGRIDTVSNATSASAQYTNAGAYAPGFADLYTYGSWFDCGGYGLGWRPFGANYAWSPFNSGQWLWDPSGGWTFASSQPWGWAPYHYGGWLFDASCGGWLYSPPFYYGNGFGAYFSGAPKKPVVPVHPVHPPFYRASTAVFVRQNGQLGIVPMNPSDKAGKTPLNLANGVFAVDSTASSNAAMLSPSGAAAKWETVKSPAHDAISSGLVATTAPERVSRTLIEGSAGTRVISLGHNSSIVYDPHEHRFVNTNSAAPQVARNSQDAAAPNAPENAAKDRANVDKNKTLARNVAAPVATRAAAPPRAIPNPPSPRSSESGSRSAEFSGGGSHASSAASAPASHASAPASSGGGGGKPH
jgi:FecR protein